MLGLRAGQPPASVLFPTTRPVLATSVAAKAQVSPRGSAEAPSPCPRSPICIVYVTSLGQEGDRINESLLVPRLLM